MQVYCVYVVIRVVVKNIANEQCVHVTGNHFLSVMFLKLSMYVLYITNMMTFSALVNQSKIGFTECGEYKSISIYRVAHLKGK